MPTELLTLLGSSTLAGLLQLFSAREEHRQREREVTLAALGAQRASWHRAREIRNGGFAWTRRLIALLAVLSIVVLPKAAALFWPELPVVIGTARLSDGFLFFTSDKTVIDWEPLRGLVLTPLDTHLLTAIVGLYFGGSLTATARRL